MYWGLIGFTFVKTSGIYIPKFSDRVAKNEFSMSQRSGKTRKKNFSGYKLMGVKLELIEVMLVNQLNICWIKIVLHFPYGFLTVNPSKLTCGTCLISQFDEYLRNSGCTKFKRKQKSA